MNISFATRKLEKQCCETRLLQKTWGKRQADKIRQRLNDLWAADNLGLFGMLPGRCHELKGDRDGQLSLDLVHPYRLLFEPGDDPVPRKVDGGLDWKEIKSVIILGIEDTHG